MKNKLVINIIIAYFVVLCIVLVIQLNGEETEIVTQIQTVEANSQKTDKIKDSVFIKIDSSSVFMNDKLFSIDEQNELIVPKIINGSTFVPAKLFSSAFKGDISWDNDIRQVVIRYNNKAVILKENENKIKIVDNINEKEKNIQNTLKIINGSAYIPLKDVAEAFDKNVFFDKGIVIISNIDNIFDLEEDKNFISEINEKFKMHNVIVFEKNNNLSYVNSKTIPINEKDSKVTPVESDNIIYIPIKAISSVFGGQNSWDADLKEITLNYKNSEVIFNSKTDNVTILKDNKESKIQMPNAIKFFNEYSYLSVDAFADIFEKNIVFDKDFIIISGKDNIFQKEKDRDIIDKLEKNIRKISQ